MKTFLDRIKTLARKDPKRIIFPEGNEDRILKAIEHILEEKTAYPILIGLQKEIQKKALNLKLSIDWKKVTIVNPKEDTRLESYAKEYVAIREEKISKEKAIQMMQKDINLWGTMMVHREDADGMISGATFTTGETIRPALQIIKTKEKFHKVSGFFFMILEDRLLMFADCAVIIEPNAAELAEIAIDTAETAQRFGIKPRIAMLSFSTGGSVKHPVVDKVREATKRVQYERPDLIIEGEMQVDAALVPEICKRKFPEANSCGDFNVLIFPNLEAGNIAYKLVQRLAHAQAIGPIFQGLKKPINDLSRGCSVQDIVDLTAFTTIEAQKTNLTPLT